MLTLLRPASVLFALLTVLTGVVYPLLVTGIAQLVFPEQANGSLVLRDGEVVGSALIGQHFDDPAYVWGRPSATGTFAYDASASTGSNQGPLNPALREAVASRVAALREASPGSTEPVPVDLVTASGSGLDPHISPAAALHQVSRVARARGVEVSRVRAIVEANVEQRTLGLLGAPRVNVLFVNLALDEAFGAPAAGAPTPSDDTDGP
ncbi:MAG: potassium-transporting ATPase subunit KdpC [Deltaproteobacteria bacterium]|nr:potassium-transporting ATPase subunit KdpC [Deltaproteobacteria bacterium]